MNTDQLRQHLLEGHVIPALPLALDESRQVSERHQKALVRYYVDSGCGGLAVGVHSTQFEIRDPQHGLFEPLLKLASRVMDDALERGARPFAKIAGACGRTEQALAEAETARDHGYDAVLLSMAALRDETEEAIVEHSRRVAEVRPIIGFYLQPAVGGRVFSIDFWRQLAQLENLVAVKIAPFNRFQTLDVVRAITESGRTDVALYTGNDDNIVIDLLTRFQFKVGGQTVERQIVGGLLGHWGVWTRAAVTLFQGIKYAKENHKLDADWLTRAAAVTDMNAALFDAANGFRGCIPGILEILRRQGLVPTNLCLNPQECLSPGQADELSRVAAAYPELTDDEYVAHNLERWLR